MKRIITLACVLALSIAGVSEARPLKQKYTDAYYSVAKKHGKRAPGRNIRKYGVKTKHGSRPATYRELAASVRRLRSMNAPWTYLLTAVPPSRPPDGALTLRNVGGLPACTWVGESGGNYRAVNTHNPNRPAGKYQIITSTWKANGGSTATADAASPAEQDQVAARIYAREGGHPWANC